MFDHQVVDQRPDAGSVVAANVDRFRRRRSGEGHDRDHVGEPDDFWLRKHLVVEDEPVRLAGDGGEPCRHVLVIGADGADEHVEPATLGGDLNAAVDDIKEEQALLLVLEGHLTAATEDNGDHLFEVVGEGAGRSIGDEAEGPNGTQHLLTGFGLGAALAVEDPGYGGDRDAGPVGDVVDRWDRFGAPYPCHVARLPLPSSW